MFEKLMIRLILIAFFFASVGPLPEVSAQTMIGLPEPGTMVDFSPKFNQATLKGIIFHPQDPFKFDFILDEGNVPLNEEESKAQSQKIAAYFLTSLTTPEKEIWVNLSPFEKSRIIPAFFGNTLMGQNLLTQDYMLKQIMATALYPERQLGREFWQKVYTQALIRFGTTNIPINTFNKVWIVPDKAVVYENTKMNAVFVSESSLKVMLEKDYLAENKNKAGFKMPPVLDSVASTMSAAVIKELVIPALEKEVNEGKNFAPLRQVYNALILAKWYKDNLRNNVIAKGYVDRNKILGVDSQDKQLVSEIYRQYLKAYKKGVFNYIKEDFDEGSQSIVPRKYFSGGFMGAVNVTTTTDGAMAAASFTRRAWIATVMTAPALAQDVLTAIGNQPPEVSIPLGPGDKNNFLKVLKEASRGRGDPVEAARALHKMSDALDPSAIEYADSILRLSTGGSLDNLIRGDLLSNSSGPGVTLPGGFSAPLAITNQGAAELAINVSRIIRERLNAGNTTLRLEAALYLERVANQTKGSSIWEKVSKRGTWESLNTKNETSETVKAARLIAQAALIKVGKASRTLGGAAIVNLEQDFEELKSGNWIVQWAALAVFEAINPGDRDNRYQSMIERSLQQPAGDIPFYERMAGVALKHRMATAVPSIIKNMERFSKDRPSRIVELKNWHAHMQAIMQIVIKLSNGNKDALIENLNALDDRLTAPGATDTINSLYLGFLFALVQSHDLKFQDFVDRLNALRRSNGLNNVSFIDENQIQLQDSDPGAHLAELKDGRNVDQNVRKIVVQGGPMYFSDLLAIFRETNDVEVVKAILSKLDEISAMGINPRNNPWTEAIEEKINHRNQTIREAVTDYEQNKGFGTAVALALSDPVNLPAVTKVLRGLVASGFASKDYVPGIIRFVFAQKNPIFDPTETGQTAAFYDRIALAAKAISLADLDDTELDSRIAGNTPTDETGPLTAKLLKAAIAAAKEGQNPRSILDQVGEQDREYAENLFYSFLRNADGVTSSRVARAIDEAYQTYKKPSNPGSGDAITQGLIDRFATSSTYRSTENRSSEDMMKMADVFIKLRNKNIGYELLGWLLNSGIPQVDGHVLDLFRDADENQKSRAAYQIVETYLTYFRKRTPDNPDSTDMVSTMAGKVRAIGDVLGQAVKNKLSTVTDPERRALLGLGIRINGSPISQIPQPASTGIARPVESVETRAAVVPTGGNSYTAALAAIEDPSVGGAQLLAVLNGMLGMRFPSTALDDLDPALDFDKFKNIEYLRALIRAIAKAQEQLGRKNVAGDVYQARRERYINLFKRKGIGAETQAAVLKLFLSAPPEVAGVLFWEGLSSLDEMYPNFGEDEQKWNDYFNLLISMRDSVKALKTKEPVKYQAIVENLRSNLAAQNTTSRFINGTQYLFLKSMDMGDQNLLRGINIGVQYVPDIEVINKDKKDHFMTPPQRPKFYELVNGGREIAQVYGVLAVRLNSLTSQIPKGTSNDPLVDLKNLFHPFDPMAQIAAIAHLKENALLFQNKIPPRDADVTTYLLYHGNQYQVPGGDTQMILRDTTHFSNQDWILYMGQLMKRGAGVRAQVRRYLQDDKFYKEHPEAINELVYQIGQRGAVDLVEPLLRFYFDRDLVATNLLKGRFNINYVGKTVEGALVAMGKRDERVKAGIMAIKNNLSSYPKNWANSGPILDQIINEISNKAMTSVTNGGIDLENVHVQSQGGGYAKTAFDDPAQLAVLMRSNGLIPVIENVEPLTQTAIDQLLGAL